jgi:hypothetical protein
MRPDLARHAFNPIGCLVCDACRAQMTQHPSMCPLRVFYDATRPETTDDQRPTTTDQRAQRPAPGAQRASEASPEPARDLDFASFYAAWWAARSEAEGGGLLEENTAEVEKIVRQWFYWLAQRGWPEATEALWSRMLAFLREEENDSTENR